VGDWREMTLGLYRTGRNLGGRVGKMYVEGCEGCICVERYWEGGC
jgi:hypothetical protein